MLERIFRVAAPVAAAVGLALVLILRPDAAAAGPDPLVPPANRVGREELAFHALVGATVYPEPGKRIEKATVVVRDGRIVAVGADVQPPPGARVWDAAGLHVYPGLIEPYLEVDAPQPDPAQPGVHWNAMVTPQRRALDGKGVDEATARQLRGMGFVAAGIAPRGGIFRGQAAAVSLAKVSDDPTVSRPPVYAERVYHSVAFELARGGGDAQRWGGYPGSEMGAIALIRQCLSDADWEGAQPDGAAGHHEETCLAALERRGVREPKSDDKEWVARRTPLEPLLFSVDDELEVLRAAKIIREFRRDGIILGSGMEFRRLAAVCDALTGAEHADWNVKDKHDPRLPLIIPLNFPDKPKVASIGDAEAVELRELMTWEQAPSNPRRLAAAGVSFSLTTSKLRDRNRFGENLRLALRHGLTEDEALAALTTRPAEMLGLSDQFGTLAAGKRASFIVADGPLLARKTKLRDVWVDGIRHEITVAPSKLEGTWDITLSGAPAARRWLTIDADNNITVHKDGKNVRAANVSLVEGRLSFTFDHQPLDGQVGIFTAAATVDLSAIPPTLTGVVRRPTGETTPFFANRRPPLAAVGRWLATEADAQVRDPANGSLTITIAESAVTLNFVRKDKSKVEIKAEDVKFAPDGTLSFTHPLEPIGGTGKSSDSVTIRDGELIGESTLPDGSKHSYKAKKIVPRDERPPHKGMAGRWHMTAVDDRPRVGGPAMGIVTENGEVRIGPADKSVAATGVELTEATIKYTLDTKPEEDGGEVIVTGSRRGDILTGTLVDDDRVTHTFKAVRTGYADDTDEPDAELIAIGETPEILGLPFGAYMRTEPLKPQDVLLANATVWTGGPLGIIESGGVLIGSDGRIVWVGPMSEVSKIPGPRPPEIDCAGKHITAGLIDCHSHTGISKGVNEGGQAVTAEVRIGDVTNPDSISWYRQLAGGITTVNSLHGSANPIGGQNQVNKNRWGAAAPDDLHFAGAIPGIKFALGENVKWSNGTASWRYPQTRMGVETIIRDRFLAAREYAAAIKAHAAKRTLVAEPGPRRDLELEALAEILAGERIIHCHSYRQDEILMLARVAEEFGFKIGTYQHILEGYKVAEFVRDYSGGGSGFADWWAYKVEVQDAIPQGGPIMHEQGVVVSFNSDSDEMARRMNVEASKGHKYSRLPDGSHTVSDAEALNFVTLNPARQLRIESRVGSLEKGKDADVVVWSGSPLSSYSRAEQTWIDGRCYWSLQIDRQLREQNAANRLRITQRLLADGKRPEGGAAAPGGADGRRPGRGGRNRPGAEGAPSAPTNPASPTAPQAPSTPPSEPARPPQGLLARMLDDADAARRNLYLDFLRRGLDPAMQRSGVCGCE